MELNITSEEPETPEGRTIYYDGQMTKTLQDETFDFTSFNTIQYADNPADMKNAVARDITNMIGWWAQQATLYPKDVKIHFEGSDKESLSGKHTCPCEDD